MKLSVRCEDKRILQKVADETEIPPNVLKMAVESRLAYDDDFKEFVLREAALWHKSERGFNLSRTKCCRNL